MDTKTFNLECDLGRVFAWLTRVGIGRKFGSLPIGWYQIHQCAAIDYLQSLIAQAGLPKSAAVRIKLGQVQVRSGNRWQTLCSTISAFQAANNKARS